MKTVLRKLRFKGCRFSNFIGVWCLMLFSYEVSDVSISDNIFDKVGSGSLDFDSSTVDTAGYNCRITNNSFYSRNYDASGGPLTYGLRTAIEVHNVDALVAMPVATDGQSDAPCLERTLGLVGIHIVHKTTSRPQWIWTSFEHRDNVPEQKEVDAHDADPANNKLNSSYNFYDPSCAADKCPINETPPRPWDPESADQLQFRKAANGHMIFNSQIMLAKGILQVEPLHYQLDLCYDIIPTLQNLFLITKSLSYENWD